jgi:small subunit ribosomal protein S14
MTARSHDKVLKQIGHKAGKLRKYDKYNVPKARKFGEGSRKCKRCGRTGAHISRYGLHVCRQCFREIATKIGFKQFN